MEFPHANIKHLIFSFDKHNATYFRVPKVASTSILMTLRKHDEVEKVETYDKSIFKFAFVRNPFDRLASCFRHVIKKGSFQKIQGDDRLSREMSFESFVDVIENTEIQNMDIHFRPQHTFFPEAPDYIGRFEDLSQDFAEVCHKIGIKGAELRHENKTDKIDFKKYYNKQTANKVFKIYQKDFELFNYESFINKGIL